MKTFLIGYDDEHDDAMPEGLRFVTAASEKLAVEEFMEDEIFRIPVEGRRLVLWEWSAARPIVFRVKERVEVSRG